MAGHVSALVVGIDDYPDPPHRLSGCVNDARAVAAFLRAHLQEKLRLSLLLNAEASREAVVDGFRRHLGQAGAGDTAFFFFAGHGSQERAPEVFWTIEPDHLDETLVCHDSRQPGGWDLADKELALLLRELAGRQPHTLVVLDCCHSGSGTRAAAWGDTVRRFPTDQRDRPIESFLPGVIDAARRATSGDSGWDAPAGGQHVLLAACRDDQEAKEYSAGGTRRGAFSWFLLDALQTGGASLTYRELHKRAKALLEVHVAAQTPQLEATSDLDLDRPFLGGEAVSQTGVYLVSQDAAGTWTIDAGQVHGIAAPQGSERTELALFKFGTQMGSVRSARDAIGRAHVSDAHIDRSVIAIDSGTLTPGSTYRAIVTSLPLPLSTVRVTGDPAGRVLVMDALRSAGPGGTASPYVAAAEAGEDFHVHAAVDRFDLIRASDNRPLTAPVTDVTAAGAAAVIARLEHVARWARVAGLDNPASRLKAGDVSLEIYAGADTTPLAGPEVELSYRRNSAGKAVSPTFKVKLTNHSGRTLYCGLVGLSEMYGVENLFPQGTLKLDAGQSAWVNDGRPLSARIPSRLQAEGVTQCADVLKLIVTTSDFDVRLLAQSDVDLGYTRSATRSAAPRRSTLNRMLERVHTRALSAIPDDDEEIDDFRTTAVTIRTVQPRAGATISAAAPATLEAGVVIAPHPAFRGVARLTGLNEMGRDIGASTEPPMFRDQPGAVVPLQITAARGSDQGLSALELLDLVNPESVTPEQPLRVTVPVTLASHEAVLPLVHDGEFFLPVGRAVPSDGGTTIEIVRIPDAVTGRRSLTSAVRIAFHKLVLQPLGAAYTYPLLACVDLDADGKVVYDADPQSVRRRAAGSSRIVLFVHGIIGDTRVMAGCVAARQPGELVLAFDYENLHTRIEDNAERLRDRLASAGLQAGHGKDFQIVAHSMGGLLSRWFIERLGGSAVVTHLVMAGTPNAGSPWPNVQDWATTSAALALNGFTGVGWPVQALGWVLQGVERIDNALDQLSPGSPFLTELAASPDPGIPYTILAGNTSVPGAVLEGGDGSRLARLLRKLSVRNVAHMALTLALFREANDIAVSVSSITAVAGSRHPAPVVHQARCDHVTYFTTPVSVDLVRAALNWGEAASAMPRI